MQSRLVVMPVRFEVNGNSVSVDVEPRMTLADCLRHVLRLTGTHVGCEHGVCGACTILVDGAAVRACLMLAVQVEGSEVVTIEGLSNDEALTPLQASFRRHHALVVRLRRRRGRLLLGDGQRRLRSSLRGGRPRDRRFRAGPRAGFAAGML